MYSDSDVKTRSCLLLQYSKYPCLEVILGREIHLRQSTSLEKDFHYN